MKALVTGGAGFIGSNLSRTLAENGHAVAVLDSLCTGYEENLDFPGDVQFIRGDVRDAAAVSAALEGCDVLFHLAASVGNARSIAEPLFDADVNVMGTVRVLEAARRAGVRKIVLSSSSGIFGELKQLPIGEEHPINPTSPYGVSKLYQEKLALAYARLYEIEVVCLRYFNVYGINQRFDAYGNVIPIFVFRVLQNEPITIFGDGEQTRDFVNVRDVARANLAAAMTPGLSGAFNIGSGTALTINAVASMLAQCSGRPFATIYDAPRPGEVRHSRADISAAKSAFGYEPLVPFEEGLIEYVDWALTI